MITRQTQPSINGPYMMTLFPPTYRYFANINISGDVIQGKQLGKFAFAYFIPYVVDGSAIFINCSVNGGLKSSYPVISSEIMLAKFSVAAYGNIYFYNVSSSTNYYDRAPKDYYIKYGGMLVSTASSATLYFSGLNVTDRSAS